VMARTREMARVRACVTSFLTESAWHLVPQSACQ
jgi:hypothetical protein